MIETELVALSLSLWCFNPIEGAILRRCCW